MLYNVKRKDKKEDVMKLRILNILITGFAVFGIILLMGAVGTSDVIADYPIRKTVEMMLLGMSFMIPAIIRGML